MNLAESLPRWGVGTRMGLLNSVGLEAAPGFPEAQYNSIFAKILVTKGTHPNWPDFGAAWNALAYRYAAVIAACAELDALLISEGTAPRPEGRYRQENALFSLYGAGFSVLECACYGAFAVGGMLAPENFPITTPKDKRRITPRSTADAYLKAFAGDPFSNALDALVGHDLIERWREIRNVLTHRTAPGRVHYIDLEAPSAPADWKLTGSALDDRLTTSARADISFIATGMLSPFADFTDRI